MATDIPAVPENVTAVSYGPRQILAMCDAAANATHYRFFTQANLEQPEPVFAGNSPTPSLVISGLEEGQLYQVFVSARPISRSSPSPVRALRSMTCLFRQALRFLRDSSHRCKERGLSPEGRPATMPSTLMSSSRSGQ